MPNKRNDIFRVMEEEIYNTGKSDVRSRKYLFPRRVVWKQGCVENVEELLKEKPIQSTVTAEQWTHRHSVPAISRTRTGQN